MIRAVVINPKKAPDTSSIIPIGVISRIYFTALVILFIIKLDKKKVRIIDPKLRRSSSLFGKIINKRFDVMWEQLSDIIILKKIDKNPIRLITKPFLNPLYEKYKSTNANKISIKFNLIFL